MKIKEKIIYYYYTHGKSLKMYLLISCVIVLFLSQIFFICLALYTDKNFIDIQSITIFTTAGVMSLYALKNENDIDVMISHIENITEFVNLNAVIGSVSNLKGDGVSIIELTNICSNNYSIKYIKAFGSKSKEQKKILCTDNKMMYLEEKIHLLPEENLSIALCNLEEMVIVVCISRLIYKKR